MTTAHTNSLRLVAMVFDCPDPRQSAEFYGRLLGWEIDESETNARWAELADPSGGPGLAFQLDPDYQPPTWPSGGRPQMAHLDVRVSTVEEGRKLAEQVGAKPLPQPEDELDALFRVYADPAGHPFCLCAC